MSLPRASSFKRFRPEALFRPGSVAVIGVDSAEGRQVMSNLLAGGFGGAVLPVGGRQKAVAGVLAYPDIASLPIAPDLAVICPDHAEVAAALADLGARGAHAAVVVGMAGNLQAAARQTGVRALGPGSFGIAVPAIGLNATLAHLLPRPGRVALVSQSASLCRAVLDWAEPNGVGFSHIVGVGGNDDIGFGLVLDWLSRDPGTGAILLDVRRIKDARAFLSAARAAARLRPTMAIRAGGLLIDPSGEADATLEAALRRCGVLWLSRLEDMLAAAETLTRARQARGESLAIVTNGIGPAQLAADAVLRDGLSLVELAEPTREAVRSVVPFAFAPAAERLENLPKTGDIVYVGLDQPMKLAEAALLLAGAREVGGVLAMHVPSGPDDAAAIEALQAAAKSVKVPLLVCAMGETTAAPRRRRLAEAGVPAFATPEQAVRGFLHLVQDRRNRAAARELPTSKVLQLAPELDAVRRAFARARAAGRLTLAQDEAMAVLAAYGVPTVPSRPAPDAEEAAAAATALGFPVVLKRRRVERPDPMGRGRVALDLTDAEQVRAAAGLLHGPGDGGFLVQRQVGRARELLVRLREDPVFGPTIGFGQGGTAAQILRDVAVDLPPLNLSLAGALIARTRVAATLAPLHDLPAADADAVADALVRISQLAVDFPQICELEVNPMFADADGVRVADAWLRLRPEDAPGGRLSIPPYPSELTGSFEAAGETLTIRPIRPEDAAAHGAFFARLTPEDVRYRFFSSLRELSAEQVARLTQVDYDRELAFIAVRESTGETLGVARLVREMDPAMGEFAVVVQPDMKGKGLASHLMRRLIEWARSQGVTHITGQVLAENHPMLNFVRHLGFAVRSVPDDPEVMEAVLSLSPGPTA